MRLLAFDHDFVPAHVLDAGDDADGLGVLLEHGTLLDVHFQRGLDGLARTALGGKAERVATLGAP